MPCNSAIGEFLGRTSNRTKAEQRRTRNEVNAEVNSVWESIIRHYKELTALLTVAVFRYGSVITSGSGYKRQGIEKLFFLLRLSCHEGQLVDAWLTVFGCFNYRSSHLLITVERSLSDEKRKMGHIQLLLTAHISVFGRLPHSWGSLLSDFSVPVRPGVVYNQHLGLLTR